MPLSLAIAYIPGTSSRHSLHWVDPNNNLFTNTQ